MLWARTIRHRLGDISYGKIQKILVKRDDQTNAEWWEKCSGRLNKNSKGKTKVRDAKLINDVESLLPGTKRILNHPLWKIFLNPNATIDELYSYMGEFPIDLQRQLFKIDRKTNIPQRIKIKAIAVDYISKRNDLDALACLLIMIRESEITRQIDAYISCKWRAHQLFCRLATFQPLKSLANIIYDFIFEEFFYKNNPLPDELSNSFVEFFPNHYQIPKKYPMPRFLDENLSILDLAIKNSVINESMSEQLEFLFWIDVEFQRKDILRGLLVPYRPNLEATEAVMKPLNELKRRLSSNSRNYLPKNRFII